jgi:hypothetical protein
MVETPLPPTCATTRFRPAYIFSSTQHNNDDDLDVSINLAEGQKKAAHSTLHTPTSSYLLMPRLRKPQPRTSLPILPVLALCRVRPELQSPHITQVL